MFGFDVSVNPNVDTFESRRVKTSMHEYVVEIVRAHKRVSETLRQKYGARVLPLEIDRILQDVQPTFDVGALVLVNLGDSNGGVKFNNRVHGGPYQVVCRASTTTYIIKGADGLEVPVHVNKLLSYRCSEADLVGEGKLAASAAGAAESRLLEWGDSVGRQ
jgi:hypothetical protein